MKLFLIGWAESCPELVETAKELEDRGHHIVYWARNEEPVAVDHSHFPKTTFHSYYDARRNIPVEGIACDQFPYPDPALLEKLAATEILVLTMMNKIYSGVSVSERQHLFIQFVRYWLGVIDKFKPDLIFFNTTPHAPIYFVLYDLAKILGIKTAMFEFSWVCSRMIWLADFRVGSTLLRENYLSLKSAKLGIEDLPKDFQEYYQSHRNPRVDTTPSYLTDGLREYKISQKIKRKIVNLFLSFLKPNEFGKRLRRFYGNLPTLVRKVSYHFRLNLPRTYNRLTTRPDLNREFVYVPLHLQPECTTNPIGETFQDQIFLIQKLVETLPDGWVIYVKEHPFQWPFYGMGFTEDRYQTYYQRIASLPRVQLIPVNTSSLELITRAKAVATVSGTAGWEAILRGKPALVFGHAWYQAAPGVFRIKDLVSCQQAFTAIQNNFAVAASDTVAFLAALDRSSIRGHIDESSRRVSGLKPEDNQKNFVTAFLKILE